MKHLLPEEMVLFYYGERESAGAHLADCEQCRGEYQKLQRSLNAVDSLPVPERPEDYGSIVWKRIAPKLETKPKRWWSWSAAPRWAMAAMLVVGAFLLGRVMPRPHAPVPAGGAEKVLLVAVGDHLERSHLILAEIANSDPGKGKLDISYEQKLAEDLVDSNRLFRLAADTNGDRATASLLDDLERVLLEIAHSPSEVSSPQIGELRKLIQEDGLLFKVRVYQTKIQESDKAI